MLKTPVNLRINQLISNASVYKTLASRTSKNQSFCASGWINQKFHFKRGKIIKFFLLLQVNELKEWEF